MDAIRTALSQTVYRRCGAGRHVRPGLASCGGRSSEAGGESTLTVLVALGANAGIGVLKLVAGFLTGSAAMFAEAAHSVADTATEGLLLTALRRSEREPDREHPFGYGKERSSGR